jgi:hypothetical protein
MVLEQAMESFGWKAGLRYVERMGENPLYRLAQSMLYFWSKLARIHNSPRHKQAWPAALQSGHREVLPRCGLSDRRCS